MNQKITITIFIIIIIAFAGVTAYFLNTKNEMQKQVIALTEKNNQIEKEKSEMQKQIVDLKKQNEQVSDLSNESGSVLSNMMQARMKAKKANVKASMASSVPMGVICEDDGGAIVSGNGGGKVCTTHDFTWPTIKDCGPNASDTEWIVKNGTESNWDIVLSCKEFADCNGPQNAICSSLGCDFKGNCQ